MVYEAMLLFGVLFISGWIFSTLLEQRHALYLRSALQYWLFLILGLYFVWFWTHKGQTLAMKTWRIRLTAKDGGDPTPLQAIARYFLALLWIVPGLALARAIGAQGWMLVVIPLANVVVWALAVYTDPQRQFLHDRIAGTRLVDVKEAPEKV